MALDFKSVARNQFSSRTSRVIQSGLKKVAGNILGSALGSTSPVNSPFIGFGGAGPFVTKMLNFPNDVANDPAQGHYINFSIWESKPAQVTAAQVSKKANDMKKLRFAGAAEFGGLLLYYIYSYSKKDYY